MDPIPFVPDPSATTPPMLFSHADIQAEIQRLKDERVDPPDAPAEALDLEPSDLERIDGEDVGRRRASAPRTPVRVSFVGLFVVGGMGIVTVLAGLLVALAALALWLVG